MNSNAYQYILLFTLFEAVANFQQLSRDEAQQLLEKMDSFLSMHGLYSNLESEGTGQK